MLKPAIGYYGGKQRIASKIVEVIKTINHKVYAEPFAGGLAVLYAKGLPDLTNQISYIEAINDHDELLMNLYRVMQSQPETFNDLIWSTPYSQSDYKSAQQICKYPHGYSDLVRAWAYFVNINQSFVYKLNGGWGTGVTKNQAATWHNRKKRLPDAVDRLAKVNISCEDALRFIERWDSPQTLFYCDPPYPGNHQGHYKAYTIEHLKCLCELLDTIQGSYVLSNYAQEVEPKSAQRKIEITTVCSASGKGKVGKGRDKSKKSEDLGDRARGEILWVCDRSWAIRPELKARFTDTDSYDTVDGF